VTTSDFDAAIAAHQGTGRRLLFRRGETFNTTGTAAVSAAGPGIVGAFGTGNRPIISAGTAYDALISMTGADWRYMDLEFSGNGTSRAAVFNSGVAQNTLLRLNMHNTGGGVYIADFNSADQMAMHDCAIAGIGNSGYGGYLFLQRASIQGNSITPGDSGVHGLRFPRLVKGVVSNNYFGHTGGTGQQIKLHAANPFGNPSVWAGYYSEQIIISDNQFHDDVNGTWSVTMGSQNANYDERTRDVIVERNYSGTVTTTIIFFVISSSNTTLRNNIIDMSNGYAQSRIGISVWKWGPAVTDNVKVYNNTIYSSTGGNTIAISDNDFSQTPSIYPTNLQAYNNLSCSPGGGSPVVTQFFGTSHTDSNNLLNNSPSALFTSGTPTSPADFVLKALPNPARDTGLSAIKVFDDAFGNSRTTNKDIGASEGQ
jgi:hypothetical protein